jgi:hypothetical protein
MTASIYTDLTWLPSPPSDFSTRCRAIATHPAPGPLVRSLASHALDENQGARLGRTITASIEAGRSMAPLQPFRLSIIGNGTLDLLSPVLVAAASRHGLALQVVLAPYEQTTQAAFDPSSPVHATRPDAVLFAMDHRGFERGACLGDADAEQDAVVAAVERLGAMRTAA